MIRVAINGFGRIGRLTLRRLLLNDNVNVVAINDLADLDMLLHLFKYDSVHGKFEGDIQRKDNQLIINGDAIDFYSNRNPEELPWGENDIDVVVESTGFFRSKDDASRHLNAGAKRVIISAPPKGDGVPTVVLGVNEDILTSDDLVVSNASCTTNCLAPMVKILDEAFGIEKGFMTTVHAYTSTQRLVDAPHKDYRRARAAAASIIPTTTGAAKAVELVYPTMKGKLYGIATRVPVSDGSLTDFTAVLSKDVSADEINAVFKKKADDLKGILEYTEDPIVSADILTNSHSCIFDSLLTYTNGNLVKIVGWYDNEYGYSSRTADLVQYLAKFMA